MNCPMVKLTVGQFYGHIKRPSADADGRSLSKNQSHSSYSRISFKKEENGSEKRIDKTLLPLPSCQLFQIHGNKLKLHPVRHLGQTSVLCITHSVFFFGVVRKDAFNRLFPLLVKILVLRCITGIVCQLFVILPDMPLYGFYAILGMSAKLSGGTICANLGIAFVFPVAVPVCCRIFEDPVFRADHPDHRIRHAEHMLPPLSGHPSSSAALVRCG